MMSMNMTRILALLLLLATVFTLFAACKNDDTTTEDTTEQETQASVDDGVIPPSPVAAYDYEGYTFRVYTHQKNDSAYGQWEFYSEGYNGERINDNVYERNLYIEDKYSINFEFESCIAYAMDKVNLAMSAGEDAYDLVLPSVFKALEWAGNGYLTEVHTVPHLDLTDPWWDQSYLSASSVQGKNYSLIGSLNILAYDAAAAGFFNKNVMDKYGIENPYDLVNNGTWTMEKMFEIGKSVVGDVDGDGTMTEKDRYIMSVNSFASLTFSYGAGIQLSQKNSKDEPELLALDPMFVDYFQKMVESISKNPDVLYSEDYGTDRRITIPQEAFEEDRIFFTDGTLLDAHIKGINGLNYGLVPMPKATSEQKNYSSFIHYGNSSTTVIPRAAEDTERTGRILADIAYHSYYYLYPAYIEDTVKSRYAKDEEAAKNVDLIVNSICYDFANMMNLALIEDLRGLMNSKNTDIASTFKSGQRTYQISLNRLISGIKRANEALTATN